MVMSTTCLQKDFHRPDADVVCANVDADACLLEFAGKRAEVAGIAGVDIEVAAR